MKINPAVAWYFPAALLGGLMAYWVIVLVRG